jgi:hypothetical protein
VSKTTRANLEHCSIVHLPDLFSPWVQGIFRPCYEAHTLTSNKLKGYISTMHLPVHLKGPCLVLVIE